MMRANEDNAVCVSGTVYEEALLDHELYGEAFYALRLRVERLSGVADILPVTLPARICPCLPREGERIRIFGQLRSYNKSAEGANRLAITVFAKSVEPMGPEEAPQNSVQLTGFLCKSAVYRTTPFLREIGDMLLAVNRAYNKSDYLPCIAWGRNALYARDLPVGGRVRVEGRLQSRCYQKCLPDGSSVERTAYEVSCSTVQLLE